MSVAHVSGEAREARFEALVAGVFEPLQRYLGRRADPETAADALADTLAVVWRRLDDVPPDAELAWCYGVARRCLANHRRAADRRLRLVSRLATVDPPSPTPGPYAATDTDAELHTALARLRDDDRELLRLWAWEQLTPTEIAVVVGVSANAVSIRLHRARKALAVLLRETHSEAQTRQTEPSAGHNRDGTRKGVR